MQHFFLSVLSISYVHAASGVSWGMELLAFAKAATSHLKPWKPFLSASFTFCSTAVVLLVSETPLVLGADRITILFIVELFFFHFSCILAFCGPSCWTIFRLYRLYRVHIYTFHDSVPKYKDRSCSNIQYNRSLYFGTRY